MKNHTTVQKELIRTDISILSLLDLKTQEEVVVSVRCVKRCNISHKKTLFEQQMVYFIENDSTISEMARNCNMSVTTFKKRFAEYYKIPPHQWRIKQRLIMAVETLLSEDLSIKEISNKCHFQNTSHLTNRFKREFGVTPTQYREMYRTTKNH